MNRAYIECVESALDAEVNALARDEVVAIEPAARRGPRVRLVGDESAHVAPIAEDDAWVLRVRRIDMHRRELSRRDALRRTTRRERDHRDRERGERHLVHWMSTSTSR